MSVKKIEKMSLTINDPVFWHLDWVSFRFGHLSLMMSLLSLFHYELEYDFIEHTLLMQSNLQNDDNTQSSLISNENYIYIATKSST